MALLICEGFCNPALPGFDAAAERLAQIRVRESLRQPVPPSVAESAFDLVIAWRRQLTHTDHVHRGGNRWACGICGTERKYGASDLAMGWDRTVTEFRRGA